MNQIWTLKGGIHPPEFKTLSNQQPIAECPIFDEYVIATNQHIGAPATPCVTIGQQVKRGEVIAEATGFISAPIHAPTSGTISAIELRSVPHSSGLMSPCIILAADHLDTSLDATPFDHWQTAAPAELIKHIANSGVVGLGGATFPSAVKLAAQQPIDTLIINGTECEPFITSDDMLMREQAADIIQGVDIIAHILGQPKNIIIGIEDNKPEALGLVKRAATGTRYQVVEFPTKYPSGGEKQLIYILTGKEVPSKTLPSSIGIVMHNVGTAVAIKNAIIEGRPLTERITTVTGTAATKPGNYRTRIGTKMADLISHTGQSTDTPYSMIMGGPMMGIELTTDQLGATKSTNCILLSPIQTPVTPTECIRCGQCSEVCPAGLLPQQLYWYGKASDHDKLANYHLDDCIECGACAYVCPSQLPLVQFYRASKSEIKNAKDEAVKSERARLRFEARKARLEAAEAEKEAKRIARKAAADATRAKKAAEAAQRAQQAETDVKEQVSPVDTASAAPLVTASTPVVEPVQEIDPLAAVAAKRSKKATPAERQRTRIEKQVATAKMHNETAIQNKQRAYSPSEEQLMQFNAAIKSTEVKLAQANQRLADFERKQIQEEKANTTLAKVARAELAVDAINTLKAKKSPIARIRESNARIQAKIEQIQTQLNVSVDPGEQSTLELRLATFKKKLEDGLEDERQELANPTDAAKHQDAAAIAIEKARATAAAQKNMTEQEKHDLQLNSLQQRIEKAKARLLKAQNEESEHIAAFEIALEKLELKLTSLQDNA